MIEFLLLLRDNLNEAIWFEWYLQDETEYAPYEEIVGRYAQRLKAGVGG